MQTYQAYTLCLARHCIHAAHDDAYIRQGHAPMTGGRCGPQAAGPTCPCVPRRLQGWSRRTQGEADS